MNGVKRRRVDVEYGKGGRGRGGKLTRTRRERRKVTGTRGWRVGARGREPPVVCRPIDKQRRYCKCIGTTRCGGFIGGFSSRCEAPRARPPFVYEIDSPIVRRSILSYRLSRRGRNNRCNASVLYYSSAFIPLSVSLSLSFFSFSVCEESAAVHLSPMSPGVVQRRSCARAHPFAFTSPAPFYPRRPVLSLSLSLPLFLSRGMMDLHGGRRRTENNKAGHAIQARMQQNYTPISLTLAQSYARMKYLFRYNVILIHEYSVFFFFFHLCGGGGETTRETNTRASNCKSRSELTGVLRGFSSWTTRRDGWFPATRWTANRMFHPGKF